MSVFGELVDNAASSVTGAVSGTGTGAEPSTGTDPQIDTEALASQLEAITGSPVSAEELDAYLGSGAGAAEEPESLIEMLIGSAMDVSGRKGLTGHAYDGDIPPWAADVVKAHPELMDEGSNFDPYLGVIAGTGSELDDRVYMGQRKPKAQRQVTAEPIQPTADMLAHQAGNDYPSMSNERQEGHEWFGKYETDGHTAESNEPDWFGQYLDAAPDGALLDGSRRRKRKKGDDGPDNRDKTWTLQRALSLPYTWSQEEVTEAMERMRHAGFEVSSFDQGETSLLSVWQSLVSRASHMYTMSQGKRKITPWEALDLYKSEFKESGNFTDFQNGTKTVTSRSVTDISEGQAFSALQGALSAMLGRDPNDQEIRQFSYKLNNLAAANPSITKTIYKYKNGEVVSQNENTTGGYGAEDIAQEAYQRAQSDPEYAEYQAATTYFNAALSALGPIGNTG